MSDYRQTCHYCDQLYYGAHSCKPMVEAEKERQTERKKQHEELDARFAEFILRAEEYAEHGIDVTEYKRNWKYGEGLLPSFREQRLRMWEEEVGAIDKLVRRIDEAYRMGFEDGVTSAGSLTKQEIVDILSP